MEHYLFDPFDEDDDEEFEWYIPRDAYTVLPRINGFDKHSDKKFFSRFRMRKDVAAYVLSRIEARIKSPTTRNHAVDPEIKFLMTLRFFAGGMMLLDAGELVGVSKTTSCRIIAEVSHEIALLAPEFINMPILEDDINELREQFYERARFPRVIGSLDCTHIRIQSIGGNMAEVYRNRKGYFSLNVQTVSSANLRILDIVARFPGSVHDQTIFNSSTLKRRLEAGHFGNESIIVADGDTVTPDSLPHLCEIQTPKLKHYITNL